MLVWVALRLSVLTYKKSFHYKSLVKVQDILLKLFYFMQYFTPVLST